LFAHSVKVASNVDVKLNALCLGSSSGGANIPQHVKIYAKLGVGLVPTGEEDGWTCVCSSDDCFLPPFDMPSPTTSPLASSDLEGNEAKKRAAASDSNEACEEHRTELLRLTFNRELVIARGSTLRLLLLSSSAHGIALRTHQQTSQVQVTDYDDTICLFAGRLANGHDPFTSTRKILGFEVKSSRRHENEVDRSMKVSRYDERKTRSIASAIGGQIVGFAGGVEYEVLSR